MTATATTMVKSIWQAYFKPAKAEAEEGEAAKVRGWILCMVWVCGWGAAQGPRAGAGPGGRAQGQLLG